MFMNGVEMVAVACKSEHPAFDDAGAKFECLLLERAKQSRPAYAVRIAGSVMTGGDERSAACPAVKNQDVAHKPGRIGPGAETGGPGTDHGQSISLSRIASPAVRLAEIRQIQLFAHKKALAAGS